MKTKLIAILGLIGLLLGCQPTSTSSHNAPETKKGMIKVTVLYPNGDGKTFDMDYYSNKHFPLIERLLGDSLKFTAIDKGIASGTPDTPVPFLAIGYLYFDKLSAFQNSFGPHAEEIRGDVANYTNIQPIIQISEVQ